MPSFRCYFLDGDGHIKSRIDIEADGLSEAIKQGIELLQARPWKSVEIWQGRQRVYPAREEPTTQEGKE